MFSYLPPDDKLKRGVEALVSAGEHRCYSSQTLWAVLGAERCVCVCVSQPLISVLCHLPQVTQGHSKAEEEQGRQRKEFGGQG